MSISVQTISKEARIDGRVVPNVLEVTASAGFSQINAEATIWCVERPSWADEGSAATIWGKNTGTGEGQIFGGEVASFDWTYAPTKVGIVCQDLLARTRQEWGGDLGVELDPDLPPEIQPGSRVYEDEDDAAVIRNLLEAMAIPSSVAHINSSDWTLGTVQPVVLKQGDVVYSLIERIDKLAGYATFTLTNGTILRQRISGNPGPSGALTFSKGVTILASPRRNRTKLGIVNREIVTGLSYEGLVVGGPGVGEFSAPNPYVSSPPDYITERIQDDLVEDDAKALEIATRMVGDKNRRPEALDFVIPFDPRVQPGMTVLIEHVDLEVGSATVFVQTVAHSIGSDAKTTIRTTGGALGGAVLQPPVASFAVQLFAEAEDTGSGINTLIVLIADGSTSFDPDGTVVSYAWTITTDGTATPDSGTGAILRSVLTGATTATVTLTVTDNDGLAGTLALTQPIDASRIAVEDIYIIDAAGLPTCSSDGEQTWRSQTPDDGLATCLMPFAPPWGEIWGADSGHIYATFDKLVSPLVDLGAPHGAHACTAVWVHETDPTRLWAGFEDGAVYFGTLDIAGMAATWTPHSLIPDSPIIEIRESVGTFDEMRATAGTGYYYRTGVISGWALQHTFDTAWRMAAGFDLNLASGLNDAAPLYDEDGTPPTVPGGVEHIRGLSFGWRQQELYAADNAANLYLTDSTFVALTASADTTPAIVNHMVRSGNIDRVVYMAVGDGSGDNGFVKWIPDVKPPFFIHRTGTDAGLMIGYGPLHLPPVTADLLMVGGGLSGGVGIWMYNRLTGLFDIDVTGDAPNTHWVGVCASPLNRSHWMAWSNNVGIYRTTNAGVNWTAITGYAGDVAFGLHFLQCEFSPTVLNQWAIMGLAHAGDTLVDYGWVNRGEDNAVTLAIDWVYAGGPLGVPIQQSAPTSISYGANDDLIVALTHDATYGDKWVVFPAGTLSGLGNSLGTVPATFTSIDTIPGRTPIIGVAIDPSDVIGDLWGANNAAPALITHLNPTFGANVYTTAAAAFDAIYVGTTSGIARLSYGGGVGAIVFAAGKSCFFARAGRQRRTAIGVLYDDMATYPSAPHRVGIWDGTAFSSVAALGDPGPLGNVANWLEVLE